MGKAARWLKGLLGMKKDKDKDQTEQYSSTEKRRLSFTKSGKGAANESSRSPRKAPVTSTDGAWLRSYIAETEKDQNKHAIAVAAATAAAADAAVAAAKAAMAVVKLTSNGRGGSFSGGREKWAAMKIQTIFRGYLSRKALRALKGLVRLQAQVRGYLVRKRAIATLHSMQALLRVQTSIRSQRMRRSFDNESPYRLENRPRKSSFVDGFSSFRSRYQERFDEPRSEIQSKRLSTSLEADAHDDNPRIVEIDTLRTRSRSRRFNLNALSECGDDLPYQTISSPVPCPIRASTPHHRNVDDFEWCFADDKGRQSTARTTPRFGNTNRMFDVPTTPSSVCGDSYFRPYYCTLPNYMADTQSFKAKLRSHSAPKQRPKKRLSLDEILAARNSTSG